jgi:hypothetical protein
MSATKKARQQSQKRGKYEKQLKQVISQNYLCPFSESSKKDDEQLKKTHFVYDPKQNFEAVTSFPSWTIPISHLTNNAEIAYGNYLLSLLTSLSKRAQNLPNLKYLSLRGLETIVLLLYNNNEDSITNMKNSEKNQDLLVEQAKKVMTRINSDGFLELHPFVSIYMLTTIFSKDVSLQTKEFHLNNPDLKFRQLLPNPQVTFDNVDVFYDIVFNLQQSISQHIKLTSNKDLKIKLQEFYDELEKYAPNDINDNEDSTDQARKNSKAFAYMNDELIEDKKYNDRTQLLEDIAQHYFFFHSIVTSWLSYLYFEFKWIWISEYIETLKNGFFCSQSQNKSHRGHLPVLYIYVANANSVRYEYLHQNQSELERKVIQALEKKSQLEKLQLKQSKFDSTPKKKYTERKDDKGKEFKRPSAFASSSSTPSSFASSPSTPSSFASSPSTPFSFSSSSASPSAFSFSSSSSPFPSTFSSSSASSVSPVKDEEEKIDDS